ncbi:tRNA (N6-threonylcarbamoyladenosine(37)-N6)-methyltransferase TrmO [Alteromonas facilis]|uniref:tRNA (N6-threonylcarbamoyladenosine(37)-N6)-methyltransferase TrmO n=1 Tax=Alteromonas facilis TaxID=2048004 RepID=UPI000C285F90|nr:tRNA (N6-threonylcarbamoyladenosine(37)-N6)-methyltransferase TrmO [Alteromonas facilis]
MTTNNLQIHPIGKIETPFSEKFGIPRQGVIADGVEGIIHFEPEYSHPDYIRGIEQFSHLWLIFAFDQHVAQPHSALVRPPRLGGNAKMGVFATRSSFRPNHLGMSLVRYLDHSFDQGQLTLTVSGVDLLTQTPIFDIKPYIHYSDSIDDAQCGYANLAPSARLSVVFSEMAKTQLLTYQSTLPQLKSVITQMLRQDPRPAYKQQKEDPKHYACRVYDLDVKWHVDGDKAIVSSLEKS